MCPRPSDTAAIVNPQTVACHPLLSGHSWEDGDFRWGLKTLLLVEVRTTQREVLALTSLTTVEEYGLGLSLQEAINDLLVSLSDYLRSLESPRRSAGPISSRRPSFASKVDGTPASSNWLIVQVRALRRTLKGKLDAREDRRSHHIFFFVPVNDGLIRAAKISHSARDQLSSYVINRHRQTASSP